MRKFMNLVIGGIENKIFNLILGTVILMTAASVGASFFQTRMLSRLTDSVDEDLRRNALASIGVSDAFDLERFADSLDEKINEVFSFSKAMKPRSSASGILDGIDF